MKYEVVFEELLVRVEEVEADSEEEAHEKATQLYDNAQIVLGYENFQSLTVEVLGEIK